jgi:tripartite-type tricarboxylate transporter receptor subunit TctC
MESMKARHFLLILLSSAALLAAGTASAQQRPIRLIVPYAAGGPIDVTARVLAERVKDSLGTVIIDNKPGAGGNIGADAVAKAAPDGQTIGIAATATNAVNPWLYAKMPFNAATDFAPVTQMVRVPNVLVMNADTAQRLKINTLADLIAYGKANPGKLNFASSGMGASNHIAGELFKIMTGIDMAHVPYRSSGPALTDLFGGQVQVMFDSITSTIEHIKADRLRPLAVTSAPRSALLADTPVMSDFVPGYELSNWFGLGMPSHTPAEIVDTLNSAVNEGLADPVLRARFADLGGSMLPGSPADFGRLIADETVKWDQVIRTAHIKPE